MKKKYKLILGAALAALVAAAVLVTALRPLAAVTAPVTREDVASTLTVTGYVTPRVEIALTAPFAGELGAVPAAAGRTVAAGEVLAELDVAASRRAGLMAREQLEQQLAAARRNYESLYGGEGVAATALAAALAAWEQAQAAYDDGALLLAAGALAADDLAGLAGALAAAGQNLAAAKAEASAAAESYQRGLIASLETQLALTLEGAPAAEAEPVLITAPFAGTVRAVYAGPGTFVQTGQTLFSLYDQSAVKIEASLLAEDALRFQPGDMVSGTAADGAALEARIEFISPVAEERISTVGLTESRSRVELSVPALPARIGAGQPVDLVFRSVLAADTLTVPLTALTPAGETDFAVYALRNGKAVLTPVATGMRAGGRVEVLSGLAAGDIVIAYPYEAKVKDGSRVAAE
ncbi:MAG: HlyD family efflux transporter periplasmic adaptor subunit [Gracilibacteraceae bacterium]|jgi:HlyD family secretion protein|nr:HlyD family efflux transporter periplasmic adaptor subunit [Gracilibacteraceae bacterium]